MNGTVTAAHDRAVVHLHPGVPELARAAADQAAGIMRAAVSARGVAHVMFATGNSQLAFIDALVRQTPEVPWAQTVVFHMDEYVGPGADHPASFQRWINQRVVEPTSTLHAHYVEGLNDPNAECARYAELLLKHPLDVKLVELDVACRQQQVNEGHFPGLHAVPTHAITVTIPALLRARQVMAVVPEARKADSVWAALTGPVSTACPASALRTIGHATIHLDPESARLLR